MITKELSLQEIQDIYNTYLIYDFPKDEVRPLKSMISLYDEGHYKAYGFYDYNTLLAYSFFVIEDGHKPGALLDYLAVVKSQRNNGVGSQFLTEIKKLGQQHFSYIILESENPKFALSKDDEDIRSRRLRFYSRNNFTNTGVTSIAYGVEYCIFAYAFVQTDCLAEDTRTHLNLLYHLMFSDDKFPSYVCIHS